MANSTLSNRPTEESDSPGQEEYEKLTSRYSNPDDKDNQAAGNPTDPRSNDAAAGDASDPRDTPDRSELSQAEQKPEDNRVGRGYLKIPNQRSDKSRWSNLTGRQKTGLGIIGGGGIVGLVIAIIFGSLNFELIHIKNIFYTEVGGVQSRTYQLGRQRYYSRMFFFDKEGNFSGYKTKGIRGIMVQNRQTKKMTEALERNGYQIEFEKINGRETGRIKALHRVENGKTVSSIASQEALTRAWDVRTSGIIPEILRTIYPDETARWHGRQAKRLYKRWGLTRTNWLGDFLRDKSGLTTLEQKELAFRSALRQHLFGAGTDAAVRNKDTAKDKDTSSTDKNIKDTADQTISNNKLADSVSDAAKQEVDDLLTHPEKIPQEPSLSALSSGAAKALSPASIVEDVAKVAPRSIFRSLNALSTATYACSGKGALDSVVMGARVLRATQLMKFGMSVLNIADAVQNGKSIAPQEVNVMMSYLNSRDANGMTMFASSGWRYWNDPKSKTNFAFSNYDQEERNKYSVGGGFTGTLAQIDSALNQYKVGVGCKKVNNPFIQFGGFVVGIGAGILSGGTFTATNVVANLGVGVIANVAVNVATEMLTPMVAGTVVHGGETGTAVGNALISGFEVLSNANGANAGMMPLTSSQYKVALADTQNYQKAQLAQMSLRDRLFSTKNNHTLVMATAANLGSFSLTKAIKLPFSSVGSFFDSLPFLGRASAADSNDGCTDPDIVNHGLAATPFCNVEVGIPESMINDPQYYPDVVDQRMVDGGYVDEDGNPVAGKGYDDYLKQCTSDTDSGGGRDFRSIDIIHADDQNQYTQKCMSNPLFNMYRFYTYIGQTENDGLTGNNLSDNSTDFSEPGATTPVSGNAKQLASQILQAANQGKIKFAVLNSLDNFDNSTPEDNIRDTAAGKPASTSTTCESANRGAKPPVSSVNLNPSLLQFILEVSQTQNLQITALAGQCHTKSSSNHYKGVAVDFGCPFDGDKADQIGAKYNISDKTGESCSTDPPHYHYSIGGN